MEPKFALVLGYFSLLIIIAVVGYIMRLRDRGLLKKSSLSIDEIKKLNVLKKKREKKKK